MSERTPLLSDKKAEEACCSGQGCCSSSSTSELPSSNNSNGVCQLSEQPWKYKIVALLCAMFLAVGSHFAAHTLGAMKSTIKKEFGISNSQYGVIQSSVSIVNTVLPLLGGIFIDSFGTSLGAILSTSLIASGNILVAASTSHANFTMMIIGRILYGIGSGTVVIVQETILSQWFQGRSLAAVIALLLTVSRLSSFLAQAITLPIARWSGWYGYGFWFAAGLCVFSFCINLVYIALLKSITRNNSVDQCNVKRNVIESKKTFSWSKLMYLPHSYWLIASMEFLLGGAWGCFLHIDSELVKYRFGYTDQKAAAIASTAQVLPVFLMPFLGLLVDRYGKRTWMMIGSGSTFLLAILLLQFTDLHPIIGMISFSISLALGPVALVSSIPVILPLSLVGTGMGLVKSGTNTGASIMDIFTGLLQDADAHKGYSGVMDFFIIVGLISVASGVTLCILDGRIYNRILDSGKKTVVATSVSVNEDKFLARRLKANYFYGGVYVFSVALSWALFFRFVLF